MDSNHRRRKPADLQSAPVGRLGIPPISCQSNLSPERNLCARLEGVSQQMTLAVCPRWPLGYPSEFLDRSNLSPREESPRARGEDASQQMTLVSALVGRLAILRVFQAKTGTLRGSREGRRGIPLQRPNILARFRRQVNRTAQAFKASACDPRARWRRFVTGPGTLRMRTELRRSPHESCALRHDSSTHSIQIREL